MTDRAEYIAGLRQLADLLEAHDDMPLPYSGSSDYSYLQWIEVVDDAAAQLERARTFARLIPGTVEKSVRGDAFDLLGTIGGLYVKMILSRDAVCERVATGVTTVTEQVPDPDALAAVPTTTVTREVEDVEWVCQPLLAGAAPWDAAVEPFVIDAVSP
jgi:hypothetical protein